MLALKYSDIQTNKEGTTFIHKPNQKTDTPFLIPIIEKAQNLIDKYKQDAHTRIYHKDKVFPVKSNANFNKRLKVIADICGIKKDLSTHVARYTCNQLLYEQGVSNERRKQILGHLSINMTEHYTTKDVNILHEEMKKL